jgi:hypothetical protein
MNATRLLHWTDLEARRRSPFRWIRRAVVAAGLAGLVAWSGPSLATWHSIVIAAFAVTMIATALGMFWRADAALLARLPIRGLVLLQTAILRAARGALLTALTVAIAGLPLVTHVPDAALLRGLALIGILALVTATFIPAAAATASLMVAGGQLASATASVAGVDTPERLPTTVLGALPGTAAALATLLAIALGPWVLTGAETVLGPAPTVLLVVAVVCLAALTLIGRRTEGMSVALREVAALDRQRLAHLEVHPPRGLEALVARSLCRQASLVYDRTARLMRRRYPMAWVLGFLAYVTAVPLAIWSPADAVTWSLGLSIATSTYALSLAPRLHRPPIDLPRHATPIRPSAAARARTAWILLYMAVFAVIPTALSTLRLPPRDALLPLAAILVATIAAAALAHRRRVA